MTGTSTGKWAKGPACQKAAAALFKLALRAKCLE